MSIFEPQPSHADPLVLHRDRKLFSDEERRHIALGWHGSHLSQAEYSAAHGISPRTLRQWLRDHAIVLESSEEVQHAGRRMLDALRQAASVLEAALAKLADATPPTPDEELAARGSPIAPLVTDRLHGPQASLAPNSSRPKRNLFDDDEECDQ